MEPTETQRLPTQRLDVWLHRARLFKTRSLAGAQIAKGRVRVTRAGTTTRVTKPHYKLSPGDELSLTRAGELLLLRVESLPTRRGPYAEARDCYTSLQGDISAD